MMNLKPRASKWLHTLLRDESPYDVYQFAMQESGMDEGACNASRVAVDPALSPTVDEEKPPETDHRVDCSNSPDWMKDRLGSRLGVAGSTFGRRSGDIVHAATAAFRVVISMPEHVGSEGRAGR